VLLVGFLFEFLDFQCPFCRRNTLDVHPQIAREYIDTGKLKYVVLNFPLEKLHPQAFRMAESAECARLQGKYWQMHAHLFKSESRAFATAGATRAAEEMGLDGVAFTACLAGSMADKVSNDVSLGRRHGVDSTPTFLIGRRLPDGAVRLQHKLSGALPYAAYDGLLAKMLE
jgi:protein-disulfide isomerase